MSDDYSDVREYQPNFDEVIAGNPPEDVERYVADVRKSVGYASWKLGRAAHNLMVVFAQEVGGAADDAIRRMRR